MMSAEREFGTRVGHIQYFQDSPASFGTVGNYADSVTWYLTLKYVINYDILYYYCIQTFHPIPDPRVYMQACMHTQTEYSKYLTIDLRLLVS